MSLSTLINDRIVLVSRPVGRPTTQNFDHVQNIPVSLKEPNEIIVQVLYASIDPAMRGWISAAKSYLEPVQIGDVMRASGIGRVIASNNSRFSIGDLVTGFMGLQKFAVSTGKGLNKVPKQSGLPLTAFLSVVGPTGFTAYFGLLRIGQPKSGETLLVSAAAGATGSVVGQIGKIMGCRVVGIAGSDAKCDWIVNELGFDAAINYKTTPSLVKDIRSKCPQGVDVYFDNVGGETLEAALANINKHARVVLCGAISQYNKTSPQGPKNYLQLLVNRARMEGFIVIDYAPEFQSAGQELGMWVSRGRIKWRDHVIDGLENAVDAIGMLFDGVNRGKLMIKIQDDRMPSSKM